MSKDGYLPPGVEEWMIPGNRPEDVAWDKAYEKYCHGNLDEHGCECHSVCKLVEQEREGDCKKLEEMANDILYPADREPPEDVDVE